MYRRNLENYLHVALQDTPVVLLNGARQTGKSTLVTELAGASNGHYRTLDDATLLSAAESDPASFLAGLIGFTIIDEAQKAPALFPAIKQEVDRHRQPSRHLLTGSANVLVLPRISGSLAGRMEIMTLQPFSQGELAGKRELFIDAIFMPHPPAIVPTGDNTSLENRVHAGGYPEVIRRKTER